MKKRTKVTLLLAGAAVALAVKVIRDVAKYRKKCDICKNDIAEEDSDDLEEFLKELEEELEDEEDMADAVSRWDEDAQKGEA